MVLKNVTSLAIFLISFSNIFAQFPDKIYIKCDISEYIYFTEDEWEKREFSNEIVFSVGLGCFGGGIVDKFIHLKNKHSVDSIPIHRVKCLFFYTIKQLEKILKEKCNHPKGKYTKRHINNCFKNIFIVEEKDKIAIVYKVLWERIIERL